MEYSIKEIKTFLDCPAKYNFRYNHDLPDNKKYTENELSKNVLKNLVYYYFGRLKEGKRTELRQLKSKWINETDKQRKLFERETTMSSLYGVREQNEKFLTRQKEKEIEVLYKFFSFISKQEIVPIAVNQDFKFKVNEIDYLKGKFDLIQEFKIKKTNSDSIEVIKIRNSSRQNLEFFKKTDFEITAMAHAFEEIFDLKADRLAFLETGEMKYNYVRRNEKHLERMMDQANYAIKGIKNKDFVPQESSLCLGCPFVDLCKEGL